MKLIKLQNFKIMEKNTKKSGEIKTWNEGKPNVVGGSGALGLIGGVAGKAVKMLNFANIRSAVKQYVGKGAKPASGGSRPLTTKPKPSATSVDNWGRPGLPKLTNEYGKVLGKGDLMRRGIRPGAHGGYQVKYKAGLDAAGKQKHGWRYTHPFGVDK
jgi:hypothetical protein